MKTSYASWLVICPPQSDAIAETDSGYNSANLDPHVARELAKEPIEVQFAALTILSILKGVNKLNKKG